MHNYQSAEGHVGQSLVDRLGARRAGDTGDPSPLDPLIDDIRRLLNTRVRDRAELDCYPRLRESVFNLGLRDFTSVTFSTPEEAAASMALQIRAALHTFEPRLVSVSVVPCVRDGALTFEVDAQLAGVGQRRDIRVEATLENISARFAVTR